MIYLLETQSSVNSVLLLCAKLVIYPNSQLSHSRHHEILSQFLNQHHPKSSVGNWCVHINHPRKLSSLTLSFCVFVFLCLCRALGLIAVDSSAGNANFAVMRTRSTWPLKKFAKLPHEITFWNLSQRTKMKMMMAW